MRSLFIVIGGPMLLAGTAISGLISFVRAIRAGKVPSRPSLGIIAATCLYLKLCRPWILRWGSRSDELTEPLPGDEVLPTSGTLIQHAVTVDVPAEDAWPWVAQLGQDRGGFYSYEWLENMAGCEMVNADRIHEEWQDREIGETVKLHPETGLEVSVFEPGVVLGLKNWGNFVVKPEGPGRCRLIVRGRIPRGLPAIVYALLVEVPHFVMERKMLLQIKSLAEQQKQLS